MFKKTLNTFILISILPVAAQADNLANKFSAGLKLGMFMVDSAAAKSYEDASSIKVDIDNGFGFGLHGDYHIKNNWYVDVEYTMVSVDAKFKSGDWSNTDSLDIDSFAVYGAYRSTGEFYYLGKLGLISETVSAPGGYDDSEVGLSFSFGGGYKIQDNLFLEAEFTSIEKNVAFIGLTGRYTF